MRPLDPLVDAFLASEYAHSPVLASALGLTAYDDRLDDLSASSFIERDADARAWLARFLFRPRRTAMRLKPLAAAAVLALSLAGPLHAQTAATPAGVTAHYATLVHANYEDKIGRAHV